MRPGRRGARAVAPDKLTGTLPAQCSGVRASQTVSSQPYSAAEQGTTLRAPCTPEERGASPNFNASQQLQEGDPCSPSLPHDASPSAPRARRLPAVLHARALQSLKAWRGSP